MGKRKKISSLAEDERQKNILEDKNMGTNSKANKKVKIANKQENLNATESNEGIPASETPQNEESLNSNSKKNKGKKKLKKTLNRDDSKSVSDHASIISKKSTKIIFIDDAPQVVASTDSAEQPNKIIKKNNNQNIQQNEEEEVNDEDIDKFCEELTEEDNVQFDNWVKLIEAKLHCKKNK